VIAIAALVKQRFALHRKKEYPVKNKFVIAGIGELLWDLLPAGKQLGGAPVNFACHCGQLGGEAYPISCIGSDQLGNEIKAALGALGVDYSYVQENTSYPTGTVQVTLDHNGKPSYEICEGVAWDNIELSDALRELAQRTDAVCFGSLAQRNEASRTAICGFLKQMPADALKIFDVNLRQKFFSKEIIEESLQLANILKLSDEELPVLAEMYKLTGDTEEQLVELRQLFDLRLVAYTRGAQGSLLIEAATADDHPGCPGAATDSIGAGDSFTAVLCIGLLNNKPLSDINQHANRVGTFVCSQAGATPIFPAELIEC